MEFDEFGVDEGVSVMGQEMNKVDGSRRERGSAELVHVSCSLTFLEEVVMEE